VAAQSKSMRAPISVQGFSFKTPDEARAKARAIREDAEEYAGELRARGEDAKAESVHDHASRTADAIELAATEHETRRSRIAHREPAKRGAPKRGRQARPAGGGSGHRGGGGLFGGVGSAAGKHAAAAATGATGDVLEELVLATIAVAFLTVFLSSQRGISAFGWLTGGISKGLELLIGPGDPLKGVSSAPDQPAATGTGSTPSATPAQERRLGRQTGDTAVRRAASPVVVTAGGAGKRGGH